jgi:hypothetical protein
VPVILALWASTALSYPTDLIPNFQPEESANVTSDDELSWYKPVAVILKPATQRDFQELLKSDRVDELLQPSHSPFHQQRPYDWPSPAQDSWYFDPEELPPYQGRQFERPDRLRDAYDRFDLPVRVQSNLLSLARMGLVAIPTKEIGHKNDATEELGKTVNVAVAAQFLRLSMRFVFCLDVQSRRGQHYDKPGQGHYGHPRPGKKDKVPAAWMYDLIGPPGPPGPIGPQGLFFKYSC